MCVLGVMEFGNLTDSILVLSLEVSKLFVQVNIPDSSCLKQIKKILVVPHKKKHLKSTPVSNLLPLLVNTKPDLGTPSSENVVPVNPGTSSDKTSLEELIEYMLILPPTVTNL